VGNSDSAECDADACSSGMMDIRIKGGSQKRGLVGKGRVHKSSAEERKSGRRKEPGAKSKMDESATRALIFFSAESAGDDVVAGGAVRSLNWLDVLEAIRTLSQCAVAPVPWNLFSIGTKSTLVEGVARQRKTLSNSQQRCSVCGLGHFVML
jgi:hypothetical protein